MGPCQAAGAAAQPLKDKLAAPDGKLGRLLDAYLDGVIAREEYAEQTERKTLIAEVGRLSAARSG